MAEFLQIRCPYCGAVLKVKQQYRLESASVTCPVCHHKNKFSDYISQSIDIAITRNTDPLTEHTHVFENETESRNKRCPHCGYVLNANERYRNTCPMCMKRINRNVPIISIGREWCDIVVYDETRHINRHHADIKYVHSTQGNYFLYYDYSTNGTTIDGEEVRKGDIVRINDDGKQHTILLANNPETQLEWRLIIEAFEKDREFTTCCPQIAPSPINRGPSAINPTIRNCRWDETTIRSTINERVVGATTYFPNCNNVKKNNAQKENPFWSRIFGKKEKYQDVYSSVFAPSEVKLKSRMMVQVYLHLNEETEKVKALATEADKNAERRDYIPLQTKLKKGDKVDVVLNINGDKLLYDSSKSIIWQGLFCKCAFDYRVPSDLDVEELSCSVTLYVNGAIIGEMLFYTQIVDSPVQLNANVIAKPVKKLFISYSHNDLKSAEKIAKLYEGMDVDVFFDKHRLKSGYIYFEDIFNFINEADTFVLCWSENAAQSEYVEKERKAALELAYPNCRPREDAQISIKPYTIQPYATPPKDMIEHYHFEEL